MARLQRPQVLAGDQDPVEAGPRQVANAKVGMIHNAGVGGIQISLLST